MKPLVTYVKAQWDRVGAWVLIAVGFVALLVGWLGISGTTILAAQMPYIVSGGMVGLALIGVGGMLWLSADLKDEWRKLDAIHEELGADRAASVDAGPARAMAADDKDVIDLNAPAVRQAVRR
ncbi:MAG: hypothetical protein QOJ23_5379 [Actinomycetota bacterium]|jgi:hypothetical protein|nr:hypothetical protein [Actinomycetota bacterium]MDQ1497685.1 hypothetical protein [Actinomycetota bacterium]